MRIFAALFSVLLLAACNAPAPQAAPAGVPAALETAAHEYEEAQIAGDGETLSRLIADDYVLIGSDGAPQNKTELIAFWTADGFDPSPVTVTEPIEHVWTDGAALGGTVILSWMQEGQPVSVTPATLTCGRFATANGASSMGNRRACREP
jgi:hypothetical protein